MKKIYKGCIFNFYRYEERILNSRFFFSRHCSICKTWRFKNANSSTFNVQNYMKHLN